MSQAALLRLGIRAIEGGSAGAAHQGVEASAKMLAETQKTAFSLGDLLAGRSGDVVTAVPRRFIRGAAQAGIKSDSLYIDVLSPDELFKRVETQKVNRDLFKAKYVDGLESRRLHYLNAREALGQTHVTLSLGNRIVGIGGVRTNPYEKSSLWVEHVSVEAKHQGKGYASRIIESIYDYALRRDQVVSPSSFSAQGQKLKPVFSRLNEKFPQARSGEAFRNL